MLKAVHNDQWMLGSGAVMGVLDRIRGLDGPPVDLLKPASCLGLDRADISSSNRAIGAFDTGLS